MTSSSAAATSAAVTHADTAHADTAHADTAHADTAHADTAHADTDDGAIGDAAAEHEHRRQRAVEQLDLLDTPREERFDRITRLCTTLFGVGMAAVNLIDRDRQFTKSCAGISMDQADRRHSLCSVAIDVGELLVVEDARRDPRFVDNPFVTGDPHLRFYAGHPLVGPDGHHVGVLCLFDPQPRQLTPAERSLLAELAGWVQDEMLVDEEMARAAAVQRGLHPKEPRADLPWDLAGGCLSAHVVGGDVYDWYPADGSQVVTLADVMGKGMPAAIMGASLRAVLRSGSRGGDLHHALEMAAETMDADFSDAGAFATVLHMQLWDDGRTLSYVDAGHGLALVVRAGGGSHRLTSGGLPVGPVVPCRWIIATAALEPGDTVVAFSDGLLDRYPDVEQAFAAVEDVARQAPDATAVVDGLLRPPPGAPTDDDVTVVAIRCTP